MNILVTGSEGTIGRKLVKELSMQGYNVKGFDLLRGNNILNFDECIRATANIDVVVHCAAALDEEAKELWKVNVIGTKNLIEAAIKNNCDRFIFISTVGVYGDCKEKVKETSAFNPQTKYEKSKAEAEKIVLERQELIAVNILRLALVLAPNEYWKKIIELIKKDFPLIGSGKNYWQTVFIDDVVSAISFIIERNDLIGEDFIIAEENPLTLNEIVIEIKRQLKMKEKIKRLPLIVGQILAFFYGLIAKISGKKTLINTAYVSRLTRNRHYSIEKIKSLGWKPKYDFKNGLKIVLKELSEIK